MIMPKAIEIAIIWGNPPMGTSNYTMYKAEIEEAINNYGLRNNQAHLFTYLPPEIIRQWLWDVFAREPHEVIVEQIYY